MIYHLNSVTWSNDIETMDTTTLLFTVLITTWINWYKIHTFVFNLNVTEEKLTLDCALVRAPCSTSVLTISIWFFLAAMCRAV